jgi:hypothetical protein
VFSLPLEGGEYAMRVRLDAEDEVREINEANNTAVARITLDDARCDEDDLEPNDSFEEALPLEPGLYEDLRACSTSGGDYYRLCPPQDAEAIVIDLSFEHGRGDIDMVLFNEDRRRVASSTGVSDAESITYDDLRGGCYQLRVFVLGGRASVTNSYDMEIEYQLSDVEPPVCDDLSEPNNNFLASFPLEELPDEPQLTFCPATDVDFFSVELDEGDTFSLTAQALEMLPGDISLIVYDPSLNFVTTASGSSPTLAFDVEEGGEHYLSVSTTSQADAFPYTLSWSASQQP